MHSIKTPMYELIIVKVEVLSAVALKNGAFIALFVDAVPFGIPLLQRIRWRFGGTNPSLGARRPDWDPY